MTTNKRLFHQRHPVLTGFFILGALGLLFMAGITFFLGSIFNNTADQHLLAKDNIIGVVDLKGIITAPEENMAHLVALTQDDRVKAIIVRIDSPGGAVGASQELFREIKRCNKNKPVIASMGSVAASGGYYAALGAEKIIANPGTVTGSMGVILKFPNLKEIFEKIGYKNEVVKSGELKDIGSASRSMSAEERELLQNLIDNVHQQFIRDIASQRHLDRNTVSKLADGRIFSGEQARDLGLIDELGNFYDAVALAASLGGIRATEPNLYYPGKEDFSLLSLTDAMANSLQTVIPVLRPLLFYQWPIAQ